MFDLTGKTAIVTGAAHGIGRAIAEVLGEAGARVVVVDVDERAGVEVASGICARGDATFVRADVSSADEARKVVEAAGGVAGRIDVLCNNAAYLGDFHDVLAAPPDEWDRSVAVSLMGTVHFTRAALPWMMRQGGGSIINVASVQGMVGARESVAYTTIKTGVIGLTRSVAYDFGKHNVRANALCPGPIQTRISPKPGTAAYDRQVSKTMLGRVGQPSDVAAAALFLASDEASFVTGAVLAVDGGWTAM